MMGGGSGAGRGKMCNGSTVVLSRHTFIQLSHTDVYDLFLPTLNPCALGPETLLQNRPIEITTLEDHDHGNNNNNSNNAEATVV